MKSTHIVAALAVALAGCESAQPQPERPTEAAVVIDRRAEPRLETDFNVDWDDIPRVSNGDKDPEEVARWVIERRGVVKACLKNTPQAIGQAMELLEEIVARVPDASADRYLLAQCVFSEAAYWFRFCDSYAWEMNRLKVDRTAHESEGGRELSDEEVEAKIADLQKKFDLMLVNLNQTAKRALNLFTVYRQQRPDDKSAYDFIFKCHFFLQNYDAARQWLELILHEMDLAGIPREDPLRRDYTALMLEVRDQMADARIQGGFRKVEPGMRDRLRVTENGARPGGPERNPQ